MRRRGCFYETVTHDLTAVPLQDNARPEALALEDAAQTPKPRPSRDGKLKQPTPNA